MITSNITSNVTSNITGMISARNWTFGYNKVDAFADLNADWSPTGNDWYVKITFYPRSLSNSPVLLSDSASRFIQQNSSGKARSRMGGAAFETTTTAAAEQVNVIRLNSSGSSFDMLLNNTGSINVPLSSVFIFSRISNFSPSVRLDGQITLIEAIDNDTPSNSIVINNVISSATKPTNFDVINELTGAVIGEYFNGEYELVET